MSAYDNLDIAERENLLKTAANIREHAWELSERWSVLASRSLSATTLRGEEQLSRFGEIPAFLAALAHHLERIANGDQELIHTITNADASEPLPPPGSSDGLRAAAIEHAKSRAEDGYDQRDMLAEFVSLRRVLWEHFAGVGADERPTFEGERIVNLLLDTVIVEAADQFFSELTEALVRRAERDPLTDLYNRQAFHDKLSRELGRAKRFGREMTIVTLDLDAFKQVNDQLGHLAGDAVLKRLSTLLTTHTRDHDLVGRLGGDEFVIALIEAGMPAAQDLIRRLRIHLVPTRRQFGLPKEFGISFGAASFPHDGDTVEKLLFHADGGLYQQKGNGRGERMQEAGYAPQLEKVKVLVADDDDALRTLCRAALEVEGFEVSEAAHGKEALARIGESKPDILLLDVTMPYLDGWEVLAKLDQDPATADIPIVLMTGHTTQTNVDRAANSGVLDFVSKPFAPDDLVAAVNYVLEVTERKVVEKTI